MTLHGTLNDSAATLEAGARLARGLQAGMVLTLSGDLGAGKTTLVRGVLRGLGWTAPVKSPTYTLVEPYTVSSLYLYHFDFYRLKDPEEWEAAGFRDYFGKDSICLIEWPERVRALLPSSDLQIFLQIADPGRRCTAIASSERADRCVDALSRMPQLSPAFRSSGGASSAG